MTPEEPDASVAPRVASRLRRLATGWVGAAVVGVLVVVSFSQLPWLHRPLPVNTGPVPWPLPDHPGQRIRAARFPAYTHKAADKAHPHVHLDIFVDGRTATIPARLGLDPPSALHTHTESGMIHIETSQDDAVFTLRQLFAVWGVRLTDRCVGGYCRPDTQLKVYVGGKQWKGKLTDLVLQPYRQIALVIGRPPSLIPSRYDCHNAGNIERESCQPFLARGH